MIELLLVSILAPIIIVKFTRTVWSFLTSVI
jgi:hypothetical protein